MEFRNILIRAANWVGDAVMCVPALAALRARYPRAHIAILARPWVAALYASEPFCDELLPYDAPKNWNGFRQKCRVASALRGRHFDCAILLPNSFEAALFVWAAKIPVRIGYDREAREWLLTHPIPVPGRDDIPSHQRFYYLELLARAGLITQYSKDEPIRLCKASAAAALGRARFERASIYGPVIGISPGAAYGGAKRWLPDRFAEAAVAIARERRASIAIFGSKQETAVCESVRDAIAARGAASANFAGATTLAEFIELAAACDVYLTNDSGPMHIASALGVPTVAVFGATDDAATGPTGEHARVVREPVECSPCLLRECPIDHRCMKAVSADRVVEAAFSLLR
ncbi:MAG: lipopolysaccharide heptosyltransferase II [Bryobacteraceae bacterium]